jgi:flavin-binding protein dodecin
MTDHAYEVTELVGTSSESTGHLQVGMKVDFRLDDDG